MDIEWSETALEDMEALDKIVARRVKQSIERFAQIAKAQTAGCPAWHRAT